METTDREAVRQVMAEYVNSSVHLINRLESKPNFGPYERVQIRATWDAIEKMCDVMEYMDKAFRPSCFD